ncbi:MAG: DUF4159 domain-containing protein [Balneolaceae bacterium]
MKKSHLYNPTLQSYLYSMLLIAILTCTALIPAGDLHAQNDDEFKIARIQYRGGGDWYNDPSALTNLIRFTKEQVPIRISTEYDDVQIGSRDLQNYPFAFLTGHGTITVNNSEVENIRHWLNNGGFLYIDDDYGQDEYVREMIDRIYPGADLIEVPFSHPIYHQVFSFPDGLPKVHEHDGLPPQGFAVFQEGKMVIFYTYESNLGDAWTNPEVHNPPASLRQEALQMGVNILVYALMEV